MQALESTDSSDHHSLDQEKLKSAGHVPFLIVCGLVLVISFFSWAFLKLAI